MEDGTEIIQFVMSGKLLRSQIGKELSVNISELKVINYHCRKELPKSMS